jgi:hypothetical protein
VEGEVKQSVKPIADESFLRKAGFGAFSNEKSPAEAGPKSEIQVPLARRQKRVITASGLMSA